MKNILGRYVNRYERKHKDFRRYAVVVAVLALIVFVGVNWRLHDKGISMTSDYQCGLKEHKHTDKCYKKVLICGKEETDGSEGHTHTDSCYKEERKLTCDKEEHKHTADCYDEEGNLICDKEEHTHSKDCYTTEKKLICGKEESKPVKAHHHTDACYKKELVCGLKEHTHTAACYSNESADVEKESDWEATIPVLSGNWAEDVVSVAESQLGYEESTANFKLADDGETRKGYTRYGEWYGNKYGDWSAMFASFCLNYAKIPSKTVPVNSGSTAWITELKQKKLYKEAGNYEPSSGDLVFLDTDSDGKADHVGIITETETKDDVEDSKVTSLTAIVGDSKDAVEENTYKTSSDKVVGYCALPENPDAKDAEATTEEAATAGKTAEKKAEESTKAEGTTAKTAESKKTEATTATKKTSQKSAKNNTVATQNADGVAVQAESLEGLDISDNITNVILEKKSGIVWIPAESFDSNDQARAEITFKNVKKTDIQQNDYKVRIPLSNGLDCSAFKGDKNDLYDGGTKSGEYYYKQAEDGSWYIEIDFDKKYVDKAGTNINGQIELSFEWNKDEISDSGEKTEVVIGSWSSQVDIKKNDAKKDDSEVSSDNFSLSKKASELGYDENGAYIDYTVTLDVKNDVTGPISMKDVLTSKLFTFDGNPSITPNNYSIAFKDTKSTDTGQETTIVVGSDNTTIAKGKYEIKYRVRVNNQGQTVSVDENIKNRVTITDNGKEYPAEIGKDVKSNPISKGGTLVTQDGESYIDWTVYINNGTYIEDIKDPVNFSDIIESGQELIGDINVIKYNPDGTIAEKGIKGNYNSDSKEITYTTDTGRYYYKITYRTKVTQHIGIGSNVTFSNTGNVDGGMNGSAKGDVTINNRVISKSAGSPVLKEDEDGKWIAVIPWTSKIDSENLSGYLYTDWAADSKTTMTDAQFDAIRIYDSTGGEISSDEYTISRLSKTDSQGNQVGLFQIQFKENCKVKGPVTIKYATTTDLSDFTEGSYPKVKNYAAVDSNGEHDETDAERQFHYEKSGVTKILKYNDTEDTSGSGSMTLKPGDDTIPWTIRLNSDGEKPLEGDLTVVDTIPAGLILDESSIELSCYAGKITNYQKEVVKNADGTTTLTIKIPDEAYLINGARQKVIIKYNTKIDPDSDFYKGTETSKKFTNTATVTNKDGSTSSTREETVNKTIVQKRGSYDEPNRLLSYEIVVNPDGTKLLKSSDTLIVTDKLDDSALKQAGVGTTKLTSLKLFTAIPKKENGETVLRPGTLVKELSQVEQDNKELYTYIYDSSTNEFKAYIPDGEAYVMVATYAVTLDDSLDKDVNLQMKNKVTVSGENQESWSDTDETTKVNKKTSGRTWTGDSITIIKHDASDYNNQLEGAVFSLYQYKDNKWTLVSDKLKTSDTGSISQSLMNEDGTNNRDTLYKLVETEAPAGYELDSTPYYFMITEKDNYNLPDSISGNEDSDYSKDKVHVTKISSTDNKAATVVIERYDAQDTTTLKPGQLIVNKKWINGSGSEVTDLSELAKMPEVEVTLTKHEPAKGNTVSFWYNEWAHKEITDVKTGGYIYFEAWQSTPAENWKKFNVSDSDVKLELDHGTVYKIGPINKDVKISCEDSNALNAFINTYSYTAKGGSDAEKIDTVIGTITLDSSNSWSYRWKDLDTSSGVTYTITEKTIDGYTATYELNGEDLASDTEFEPNANGDKVTITNTAKAAYNLPETGGSGTLPFITGGAFLMGFALLCGYSMRRRRGRRVE